MVPSLSCGEVERKHSPSFGDVEGLTRKVGRGWVEEEWEEAEGKGGEVGLGQISVPTGVKGEGECSVKAQVFLLVPRLEKG